MDNWKLDPARDLGKAPKERWSSVERDGGLSETLTALGWRSIVRSYLALAHGFECSGRENIPHGLPYIIAANHSSHLDALCITAVLPRQHVGSVFAIAAADTFFTSMSSSWFAAFVLNALPLSRTGGGKGREAMHQMRARLEEQRCGFMLFPEGTRSRDGAMGHFRSGLGMLVAETDVPVIPAALHGAFAALPPHRIAPRFSKVKMRIGTPLYFREVKNEEAGWKEVAQQTETRVRELHSQLASG